MQIKEKIISRQNDRIKTLKKLSLKKYRRQTSQFMVENLAIIYDALKSGHDFELLFITEEFKNKHQKELEYLQKNSKSGDYYLISGKVNEYYSNLDTASGITAVYKAKNRPLKPEKSVIYLNGINDPGNLGTIMRTMLAFGFENLVVDKECADIYNPKTVSAAKDSVFKLNIEKDKGDWLKKNKTLPIYATSSHKGVDLDKFKPKMPFCLILGSESHGVDEAIMKMAEKSVRIKISDKIESLNVSAAAAILLYKLQ